MPKNLTDADSFDTATAPAGTDARNAASVESHLQKLANRTKFLSKRLAGILFASGDTPATGEVWKLRGGQYRSTKPVPGHYDPHDFGAVGDGVTDDHAAFLACIAAMNFDALAFGVARSGTLLLSDSATYYLSDNLYIERGMRIEGVGGASFNCAMSTVLKFAPGKCVWIKGGFDYAVGSAQGARLQNIGILCQPVAGIAEYAHSHAYSVGDLVYLPQTHEFVYECIAAGTSAARPFPVRVDSTHYDVGDLVTISVTDGHVYRCTTAGTTAASEPADFFFWPGAETTDGSVVWTEDYIANPPYLGDWADTAFAPGVDANDPSVLWTPGRRYEFNAMVRVAGVTSSVFWLGDQGGTTGGIAGATPPTAGTNGTTVSDGLLTWTRINANGAYIQTDGTAKFQPRLHPCVAITTQCHLEDVQLNGASCFGVHLQANGGGKPANNADFWTMTRVTANNTLHGFIRVRGEDSQGGAAVQCMAFGGSGVTGGRRREWDMGFYDSSENGNSWTGCTSQSHSGYSYRSGPFGAAVWNGCYAESSTPNMLIGGTVVGGALSQAPMTENSEAVCLQSQGTFGLVCVDPQATSTTGVLECFLAGQKGVVLGGQCTFAVRAGAEPYATGLTWSNTFPGWPVGWHVMAHAPGVFHDAQASFGFSGSTAPLLRDDDYFAGNFIIPGKGFYVRGIPGDTTGSALAVRWKSALPTAGKWLAGDIIYNTSPTAGGFVGWVCITNGDYAATPPVWETFGDVGYPPVATSDATPAYVTLATLAVGESKEIDVIARIAKADGSARQSFKLSALVVNLAGTLTLDGGSLTDSAPRGTGSAAISLDLTSGADVRVKIVGVAATDLVTKLDASVL